MAHVAWTDIESFHNVRKVTQKYPELLGGNSTVTYRAKVKLHGTNAGVKVTRAGKVMAMSRSQLISPTSDNAGFAKWVAEYEPGLAQLAHHLPTEGDLIVYGEWCGPGIMKGTAINAIPQKMFAVFAARFMAGDANELWTDPNELQRIVCGCGVPAVSIPWFNSGEEFIVNWFASADDLKPVVDRINACVAEVEACDPFVKETFGVEGTGEGLVFYPVSHHGYKRFGDLCFKAKGEAHKVVAKTKSAHVDPTIVEGANAFAELVVTEARCEQGVRSIAGGDLTFDVKMMSDFLRWMNADIQKETRDELEASRVDEKLANKACMDKARRWFIEQTRKL